MAKAIVNASDIKLGGKLFFINTLDMATDNAILPRNFQASLDPKYFTYDSIRITESKLDETDEDYIIFNASKEKIRLPQYNVGPAARNVNSDRYYTDETQVREMCAEMTIAEKKRIDSFIDELKKAAAYLEDAIEHGTYN